LIIDDQPANVRLLQRLLRQEGCLDVHAVTDPRQAVETFRALSPDLVLLDLRMAPVSGLVVLQEIRRTVQAEEHLPVVVLTADVSIESRRAALAAGATDFLTKPLDNLEVMLRIRNQLKTRALYLEMQRHNRSLEEAVRERTRSLADQARMMDLASEAFLAHDLENRLVYWNGGAERVYGWRSDEVLGRDIREVLYRDPSPYEEACRVVLEAGAWGGELRQVRKDGKEIAVQSRRCLVRDEQGRPWAMFSVNTDITDKKAIEQQLERAQRLESVGALAGGVAHDLNNMLTPIMMGIGVLRNAVKDAAARSTLEAMELGVEGGRGLVKQLLTFMRGSGQQRRELLLGPYLKEVTAMLGKTFPPSVRLDVQLPRDLWPVRMDVTHLYQVVMNLCINARDAMPDGGCVTVSGANKVIDDAYAGMCGEGVAAGPYVVLSVSDTGTGIAPELLGKIFEPFFTTKGPDRGTGLGLSTTAAIVKDEGGFLQVASRVGHGSRFDIFLPASGQGYEPPAVPEAPLGGRGELILVADDEAAIREIVRTMLESAGYRVRTASDATDAVALVARHGDEARLLLTDWRMPGLDSPSAIRAVHKLQPRLPVVVVSGSLLSAGGGLEGVRGRLAKPFTANELLRLVRDALDGGP
jgi:PAS domain S-box-containing protein